MPNRLILLFLFHLCTSVCIAHPPSIRGRVVDHETGLPVPGATVILEQTNKGTITNLAGEYFFYHVDKGNYSLKISYLGYDSQRILISLTDQVMPPIEIVLVPGPIQLEETTITADEALCINHIGAIDLKLRPLNSSQDALQTMPGLFVAQHAGGGKAEQIFLRGFDIDHGTDVAIDVDGIPVNMVSHAHGQGYADLHFLIPEIVREVDFAKGPHDAGYGNFATAGRVSFHTLDALDRNIFKTEVGLFDTYRIMAAANLPQKKFQSPNQSGYVAGEYRFSNGPFESPQNLNRINLFGKYRNSFNNKKILSTSFSAFQSEWDASGQIPVRAVKSGLISRFGAIDDTEGGNTGRANANLELTHFLNSRSALRSQLYYSRYWFELYSNFTFFLNDSINGDQIRQKETRDMVGYLGDWIHTSPLGNFSQSTTTIGWGARYDHIVGNELSHTRNRNELLERYAYGDVDELNAFTFISEKVDLGTAWTLTASLRFDQFLFAYRDRLENTSNAQTTAKNIFSPKAQISFKASDNLKLFLKTSSGFHSNDTRVGITNKNAKTLPRATAIDLGSEFKPFKRLIAQVTSWWLSLENELIFVGDEAIVERSGSTIRTGADMSLRYQVAGHWFADFDLNYVYARLSNEAKGENYIPLAPGLTSSGGISYVSQNGLSGGLRYRFMDDRPANETYSQVAKGYTILDLVLQYTRERYQIGLSVQNLLNTEWDETQFETTSRLKNETSPVSEIHFTPGTPFFSSFSLSYFF